MQCHKPTSCGDPDISQYIEYISFGLIYLAFTIGIIRHATGASHRSANLLQSPTGKSLFVMILLLCILRIIICADIWFNIPEGIYFFLYRVVYVPFGVAVLLLTLSWTKLWFSLLYLANYQKKLRICQITSYTLYCFTALCGLIFGYFISELFYAFLICALMYLYMSILYFVSAFQVFYSLQRDYPILKQMYGKSLRINASVVSFCILSRVVMNIYLAFTYERLNTSKVRQVNDIVMLLVCEIVPLFFAFIRMYFEVAQNQSFKTSIEPDNCDTSRLSDHQIQDSTVVFFHFKDEELLFDDNLNSTLSTNPHTQGPNGK